MATPRSPRLETRNDIPKLLEDGSDEEQSCFEDSSGDEEPCCPEVHCLELYMAPPKAPSWILVLSAMFYFVTFLVAAVAIVWEFVDPPALVPVCFDCSFRWPLAVVVACLGLFQYMVESVLAFLGVVTMFSWTPFHGLQHHLCAFILALTLSLQMLTDPNMYWHMSTSFRSLRMIVASCGLTGINETLWVLSGFLADPKVRWASLARVCVGSSCLIQNICVCVPCCALYAIQGLWPLYTSTGSYIALLQVVVNGVIQPLFFNLYLQTGFLRLQFKLIQRLTRNDGNE